MGRGGREQRGGSADLLHPATVRQAGHSQCARRRMDDTEDMISLRTATASSLAILFTAIAVVVGATSYLSTMRESGDFLDLQQRQIARYVGDLTFIAPGEAALPPHDSEDDYVIEVTYADGRAAKTSDPSVVIPDQPATGFSAFSNQEGEWRVFSLVTPGRTVQVAQQVVV